MNTLWYQYHLDLARLQSTQKQTLLKMAFRAIVLAAVLAVANAGYLEAPVASVAYSAPHAIASPAVVSQHSNILRSHGNLGQVSTYSKSIQTPHSSVSKTDIRVSNDALAYAHAPAVAYAAPAVAKVAYSAPAVSYAAPAVSYAAPAVAKVAYSAPAVSYAAPAVSYAAPAVAKVAYSAPAVSYAAPAVSYAAPAVAKVAAAPAVAYAAPAVAKVAASPAVLGVAYSAAPAVSHMTYSNSYGIQYGW